MDVCHEAKVTSIAGVWRLAQPTDDRHSFRLRFTHVPCATLSIDVTGDRPKTHTHTHTQNKQAVCESTVTRHVATGGRKKTTTKPTTTAPPKPQPVAGEISIIKSAELGRVLQHSSDDTSPYLLRIDEAFYLWRGRHTNADDGHLICCHSSGLSVPAGGAHQSKPCFGQKKKKKRQQNEAPE